jgi:hypothetical protein
MKNGARVLIDGPIPKQADRAEILNVGQVDDGAKRIHDDPLQFNSLSGAS